MSTTQEALKLNVMLGDYPNTVALKQGKVESDRVQLELRRGQGPPRPLQERGERRVRRRRARDHDLPAGHRLRLARSSRCRWCCTGASSTAQIAYNAERGVLTPADLHGQARRHAHLLADDAHLGARHPAERLRRRSVEGQFRHLRSTGTCPSIKDPPNAQRAPAGKKLLQMLLDGELDAAVLVRRRPQASQAEDADPRPGRRRQGLGQRNTAH